ncbi:hypothetical protein BDZ45DRAFT_307962 [Acephala macrosclerotiorum]|nr:hypothetical protein BDZ45DRAFT_307962 [Acephala macrosclerotiorum]
MATSESSGMHFIISTDVKKANPETRKLIRSHVMLGKNRTKSSQAKRRKVTTSRVRINDHDQTASTPLDEVIDACRSAIPRRVSSDLSFTNFAVELEPATWGDIIKFFTISLRIMCPLASVVDFHRKEKSWFEPYALDAAYIHVTIFAVEAFAEKITYQETTQSVKQEAALYFLKGVQLLRERLLTEDEEVKVSDSTISTVLTLAMSAKLVGEYETTKQHMEGLRKMVNLRGGLGKFGDKKLLLEILRCDIAMALHTSSSTVFFDVRILEPLVLYPGEISCSIQKCP